MKTTTFIGIIIGTIMGIGFAYWTYPMVKPVFDKYTATQYDCRITATRKDGSLYERHEDVLSTELKTRKVIGGFSFERIVKSGDEYVGFGEREEYPLIMIHCERSK